MCRFECVLTIEFIPDATPVPATSTTGTGSTPARWRVRLSRLLPRRIEAVDRIQHAASGLVERISEIEAGEQELVLLERRLQELTSQLVALPLDPESTESSPSPSPA